MIALARRRRAADWPARLATELVAAARRPWRWGEHDCVSLAARCAAAILDLDRAALDLPTWTTAAEAGRALAARGGLEAAITARVGRPWAAPGLARGGDLALVVEAGRPALAVVLDRRVALAAPFGWSPRPLAAATTAWGLGWRDAPGW